MKRICFNKFLIAIMILGVTACYFRAENQEEDLLISDGNQNRLKQLETTSEESVSDDNAEKPGVKEILSHMKVMQELKEKEREKKQRAEEKYAKMLFNKGKIKRTQATALFSVDRLTKKIKNVFNLESYAKIINDIIGQEKKHFYTHYPFYHAQSGDYRIIQDLYRKLYEFFYMSGELKNFSFLRFQSSLFDKYRNISDFLRHELKEHGIINDNVKDTRTLILSVNLSPFGNPYIMGEATWYYFENALSWVKPNFDMIADILKAFNLSTDYVDDIIKLSEMIKTKEGSLFQIFVPKNKVNDHVYLAWRQGVPNDEQLLRALFKSTKIPASKINEALDKYQYEWSSKVAQDPWIHALFDQAIERINSGTIKISDILDQYTKDPKSLKGIEHLQARILLSNEMLLNPESGVIIYRYTTIPKETLQEYDRQLTDIVQKIINKWIESNILKKEGPENKTRAETLFNLILKQSQ